MDHSGHIKSPLDEKPPQTKHLPTDNLYGLYKVAYNPRRADDRGVTQNWWLNTSRNKPYWLDGSQCRIQDFIFLSFIYLSIFFFGMKLDSNWTKALPPISFFAWTTSLFQKKNSWFNMDITGFFSHFFVLFIFFAHFFTFFFFNVWSQHLILRWNVHHFEKRFRKQITMELDSKTSVPNLWCDTNAQKK